MYEDFMADPHWGWKYLRAYSSQEGIETLRTQSIDLLLLDNDLDKEGDGLTFLCQLRKNELDLPQYMSLPVVMISMSGVAKYALEFGSTGYIDKWTFLYQDAVFNQFLQNMKNFEMTRDSFQLMKFG